MIHVLSRLAFDFEEQPRSSKCMISGVHSMKSALSFKIESDLVKMHEIGDL